jgi:hypothetical protein
VSVGSTSHVKFESATCLVPRGLELGGLPQVAGTPVAPVSLAAQAVRVDDRGQRQHAAASGPTRFRDVVDPPYGLAVEPDGRLHHDSADARDADLDRDLDAAVDGLDTVRLGWGQVYGRPCRTAARIAILLRQRGWTGSPHPCGPHCELA